MTQTTVLLTMHVESEGPGTLGSFLESSAAELRTVKLHRGQTLPEDMEGLDAIISMGGPMNVYEDDKYPFLKQETEFLRKALHADVPVLGICLGAQLAARACGARVTESPGKEVGWGTVALTDAGERDPLFQGVPSALEVLQWHENMFDVPEDGTLLVTGAECPHQAFRCGNAIGLQFHVEVTREILSEWFADFQELPAILTRFDQLETELGGQAYRIYDNWLAEIRGAPGTR